MRTGNLQSIQCEPKEVRAEGFYAPQSTMFEVSRDSVQDDVHRKKEEREDGG
jgi:hypothetical protein